MMCIVLAGCFGGNEKQEWIEDFTECEYYSGSEGWERVEGFKKKHGDHDGFIEIDGDNNDVELLQRGNSDEQYADIVVDGDGHTIDALQRYGDHTANIDITNGGGAYTLDLEQTDSSARTYSLTGICTNGSGCAVSVTQN